MDFQQGQGTKASKRIRLIYMQMQLKSRYNPRRTASVLLRLVALALALLVLERPASAELFQYATSPPIFTPPSYPNTPSNVTISLTAVSSDPFFDENLDASGGGTDIIFGHISVLNLNHNFSGVVISPPLPFEFMITISDYGPGNFGPPGASLPLGAAIFDVMGTLSGTIGPGNQMQITASTYTVTPMSQPIAGDDYLLSNSYFIPPSPGFSGGFGIHVTATPVPEPATFGLFALGIVVLAAPAYRRWRAKSRLAA